MMRGLRIANNRLSVDLGEVMDRLLAIRLPQNAKRRVAFKSRHGARPPTRQGKRIVAELANLDTGLTFLVQFLTHIVQKCRGNAERKPYPAWVEPSC